MRYSGVLGEHFRFPPNCPRCPPWACQPRRRSATTGRIVKSRGWSGPSNRQIKNEGSHKLVHSNWHAGATHYVCGKLLLAGGCAIRRQIFGGIRYYQAAFSSKQELLSRNPRCVEDIAEWKDVLRLPALIAAGATVGAYDPADVHEAEKLLPSVVWCQNTYEAARRGGLSSHSDTMERASRASGCSRHGWPAQRLQPGRHGYSLNHLQFDWPLCLARGLSARCWAPEPANLPRKVS